MPLPRMQPPVERVLYLHGFRSSPASAKSRFVRERLAADHPTVAWHGPQLPPSPREAMALIDDIVAGWPPASSAASSAASSPGTSAVIGSSLGGYYATACAERHGLRAVLLNPAIEPARDLARHIGEQTAWHSDDRFFFRPEYVDELLAMRPATLSRLDRYFALIATGDEVLSWREMAARYAGANVTVIEGSDHALTDFAEHWPAVEAFLGL